MSKKVVLVGHCGADSTYLRIAVNSAAKGVSVVTAHDEASLRQLLADGVDLVLLNRTLDYGFTTEEGAELAAQLRASNPEVKTMLVSNYPDAQQLAVRNGALPGFGKRELGSPRVKQLLADALGAAVSAASK
jgi:DNA-binding NarL/FixJ family response regulator